MLTRRTQEERREAASEALLAAGRKLFGARGYAGVSSAALAAAAGLTTGAMYRHFEDKAALFRAVFESVEAELAASVRQEAAGPGDALIRVEKGALAFLVAAREPLVRRIVLIDGPAVLGWEPWRHIDENPPLPPPNPPLLVA